ncbi:AaceriAEL153Wp [[Ashbya] aceris (nom. inval.)]|nr:AaceriAEL153Wp [[Ashbya] aceris (nom. inval.)]
MVVAEAVQELPPDEEELALAKLVFGDTADFHEALRDADLNYVSSDEDVYGHESSSDDEEETEIGHLNDDQLFFVDEGADVEGGAVGKQDAMDVDQSGEDSDSGDESGSGAAWSDSDDEHLNVTIGQSNMSKKLRTTYAEKELSSRQYVQRLRQQFEKIYPRPLWVDEHESDSGDESSSNEDDEQLADGDVSALAKILQNTYSYKSHNSTLLPPKTLDIVRLKDANISHPSRSAIQSLSFHPLKPLLLTGGYDRTLRIYHIDGKHNHMVSSVYLKGTPVQTCKFYVSPSHSEQMVLTGGRRRYMHTWDLMNTTAHVANISKISRMYGHEETQRSFEKFKLAHLHTQQGVHGIILLQGNNGWVNILHAVSGIWLMGCKIEGVLVDFCIDYQSQSQGKFRTILIATNTYGQVWEFDLTDGGAVIRKWNDDGGVAITTIQVGGGTSTSHILSTDKVRQNRWLALGSESGFVNVYDRQSSSAKPVATLSQLTTTISSLEFSPDGQVLCIASRATKDALRLIHLPTCSVFSNWPTSGTPLGKVTSVAFSTHGEMLAVGNEQGKVRLWRLSHYQ